jgi:branched-chain amino acid transport system ATP-binding protein
VTLLEVDDVRAGYGDFEALHGVSIAVEEGRTIAIIGANGAGKSTLLKVIAGLLPARAGRVAYDGRDLTGRPAHARVADGISLVPEGRRLFASLTVRENLLVGGYRKRKGPWSQDAVFDLFTPLRPLRNRPAAQLSGGEQQMVAIGRALMANPRLLLLDEVSLGLAPIVVRQLYAELPKVTAAGTTVLLVEQDVAQARAAADHMTCLLTGRISLEGAPEDLDDDAVRRAYFGM